MLKSRLLTAFLMGPIILWAIYAMPENFFALFSFVLVSLGAWEWAAFAGWKKPLQRGLFFITNILLFVAVLLIQNTELNLIIISLSLYGGCFVFHYYCHFPIRKIIFYIIK